MSNVSLNGHTLTVRVKDWVGVLLHLQKQPLDQVTIVCDEEGYVISRPLPKEERGAYAHLYHRQGRRPGDDGKPPKPPGPRGGGPSGTPGSGQVAEYTFTEAKAA